MKSRMAERESTTGNLQNYEMVPITMMDYLENSGEKEPQKRVKLRLK